MSTKGHEYYPHLAYMASGNPCIALSKCTYDEFPSRSCYWAQRFGAVIEDTANGPDERLLLVQIDSLRFWIAFDEFSNEISLEPGDEESARIIPDLFIKLTAGDKEF